MTIEAERRCFVRRAADPQDIMQVSAVNTDQASQLLLYLSGRNYRVSDPVQEMVGMGMLSKTTAERISNMPEFNNAEWFLMLTDFMHYRQQTGARMPPCRPHTMSRWKH
jgi:hypothetical protein